MTVAIGNDHTAHELKAALIEHLRCRGADVADLGADASERSEYPYYAERAASAVAAGEYERAVLLCGTGAGMCIAANKVNGIRAVMCSEPYTAKLSREHNDSNILCLGARVVGAELAKMITDAWLDAEFLGGRHKERVEMIAEIERKYYADN